MEERTSRPKYLYSLGLNISRDQKLLSDIFPVYCKKGWYPVMFHLPYHHEASVSILGSLKRPNSFESECSNTQVKSAYQTATRRYSFGAEILVYLTERKRVREGSQCMTGYVLTCSKEIASFMRMDRIW